jgi:hypothetical protein
VSASCPHCFTPGEREPSTHWIGVWVGPRAGMDAIYEKTLAPARNLTPAVQPVAHSYTELRVFRLGKEIQSTLDYPGAD